MKTHSDGTRMIRWEGEIDSSNIRNYADTLEELVPDMTLDISDVSFFDAQTLGLLIQTAHRAQELGYSFQVIGVSPPAAKVFRIVELDKNVTVGTITVSVPGMSE